MKKLLVTLTSLALFTGCAYLHSTTEREPLLNAYGPFGTNYAMPPAVYIERTSVRVYTLFDGNANVTRFSNGSGYYTNKWGSFGPGTGVGTINEQSSTSNLVDIIGAVAKGVASGLKP